MLDILRRLPFACAKGASEVIIGGGVLVLDTTTLQVAATTADYQHCNYYEDDYRENHRKYYNCPGSFRGARVIGSISSIVTVTCVISIVVIVIVVVAIVIIVVVVAISVTV